MKQSIINVALLVRDYDEAIAFYTEKLKFELVEDSYEAEQDKRWVVIAPRLDWFQSIVGTGINKQTGNVHRLSGWWSRVSFPEYG